MKVIKHQKRKHLMIPAIFFSLLIHVIAGAMIVFCSSTNLFYSPELNGINMVWVSFDDKSGSDKAEIKSNQENQSPLKVKKTTEQSVRLETPTVTAETIPVSAVTAQSLSKPIELAKNEMHSMGTKEKYNSIAGGNNEKAYGTRNSNTAIAYPLYKENSPPVYPEIARVRGYEGVVLVFAEILPNGRVGKAKISKSSGYAILDQSAIRAIKPWKFEPAKKSGNPFTAWVELPIKFILHNNSQS